MEIGTVQFLSRWAFLDFLQLGRVAGGICIWFLHFLDTFLKWPVGRPQSHSWAWVFTWLGSAPCPKITGSWQGFPSSPGKRNWQEEHQCPLVSDGPLPRQLSKQLSQSWGRGDTGKSGVDSSLYTLVQWLIAFLCPWGDLWVPNPQRNSKKLIMTCPVRNGVKVRDEVLVWYWMRLREGTKVRDGVKVRDAWSTHEHWSIKHTVLRCSLPNDLHTKTIMLRVQRQNSRRQQDPCNKMYTITNYASSPCQVPHRSSYLLLKTALPPDIWGNGAPHSEVQRTRQVPVTVSRIQDGSVCHKERNKM